MIQILVLTARIVVPGQSFGLVGSPPVPLRFLGFAASGRGSMGRLRRFFAGGGTYHAAGHYTRFRLVGGGTRLKYTSCGVGYNQTR